ncbi:hypothetical protein CVT25_015750 [Psilocybe cyanescens]|uniref:Uncharacterized protein n=1 Tax=Psilocybe cyanescens TaxID=93625 RepID=A0A409WRX4_PSICY|nr:hypothetical protein CVT25_015750 [Psilocybe cyanescens]
MARSLNLVEDDSDDEIIWGVSEESLSTNSSENESEDYDYVVLNKPPSPLHPATGLSTAMEDRNLGVHTPGTIATSGPLETQMSALGLTARPSSQRKKAKKMDETARQPQPVSNKRRKAKPRKTDPSTDSSPKVSREGTVKTSVHPAHRVGETEWFEEMAVVNFTGLGSRSIVDDYSDRQSVVSYDNESFTSPTLYEEASTFISSFLSNPEAKNDTVCRLALLQSLIIELGLATPSLPDSLSAARAFLRSRAFLNIREYIAVREQGPEAVQRVLYPSKSALIKDIKKRRNTASLKWVKQHGLQVLLVGWTH